MFRALNVREGQLNENKSTQHANIQTNKNYTILSSPPKLITSNKTQQTTRRRTGLLGLAGGAGGRGAADKLAVQGGDEAALVHRLEKVAGRKV